MIVTSRFSCPLRAPFCYYSYERQRTNLSKKLEKLRQSRLDVPSYGRTQKSSIGQSGVNGKNLRLLHRSLCAPIECHETECHETELR